MSDSQTATAEAPANGSIRAGDPPADDVISRRLEELRAELAAGEARLLELDGERARVRDTVLRIQGAIMALEELSPRGAE